MDFEVYSVEKIKYKDFNRKDISEKWYEYDEDFLCKTSYTGKCMEVTMEEHIGCNLNKCAAIDKKKKEMWRIWISLKDKCGIKTCKTITWEVYLRLPYHP